MTKSGPIYKKLTIKWSLGGLTLISCEEKMVITSESVSFERKTDNIFDPDEPHWTDCKWKFKTNEYKYLEKFDILCIYFANHRNPKHRALGCDVPVFSIETERYDGVKYKEDYMCDLLANGFDEFVEMLKEFIPQLTSEPYFIAGVPEDSDEEEE